MPLIWRKVNMGESVWQMKRFDWSTVIVLAVYYGLGLATVFLADAMGLVHQSNPVIYFIGALLRAWLWPWYWFMMAREYLLGF